MSWDELAQAAAIEPATVAEERVLVSCTGTALVQPDGDPPHRDFSFRLSFQDEPLASFAVSFRAALEMHKALLQQLLPRMRDLVLQAALVAV